MALLPAALVLLAVAAVHGAVVKDKPAGGYGAQDAGASYYQPPVQPNYAQVPVFVPPPKPYLHHTHLCARDVGYTTYGGKRHRSRRPTERTCDDVFMPSGSGDLRKDAMKNCDKCCKSTARLNGFSTNEIRGFITVIDKNLRCTCCAPALPTAPFPYSQFPAQPSLGYGAVPAQSPVSYAAQQPPVGYGAVPAGDAVQPVAQDAAPISY